MFGAFLKNIGLGLILVLALVSCSRQSSPRREIVRHQAVGLVSGPGPELRLIDTLTLAESDSLYLGDVGHTFAVDDSGAMYFPDLFVDHVVQFSPHGKPLRVFGKHGRGPGELVRLGATFVIDSFLIQDIGRALVVFNRNDGSFVTTRGYRGFITAAVKVGERLWMGDFDPQSGRGLFAIDVADFVGPEPAGGYHPLTSTRLPFPAEYEAYRGLEMFNYVLVTAVQGGLVVGFAGTDALSFFDFASERATPFRVPFVARRGTTAAGLRVLAGRAPFNAQLAAISALAGLWTLSDGSLLVWYADNSAEREGRSGLKNFTGRAYFSLVAADRSRACVDSELPFPGSNWPRIAFAHDTLYALDQYIADTATSKVRSVVRRYAVSGAKCAWLPVGSGSRK